jgi:hypothetical protein
MTAGRERSDVAYIWPPALRFTVPHPNNPAAGAQLVLGSNDEVLFIAKGLLSRIQQGLVDFDTGEGFHGQIAFDFDGDGVADASTWIGLALKVKSRSRHSSAVLPVAD